MKRVVITGMGVISPVGNSLPAFWDSLKGGVCGVGPITKFDTADFKVKVAAEVKDFNAADFGMDVPTQRRMDLFTQYAMAAAKQAVEDSGILGAVDPERFGVYVGSGIGGMNTFIEQNNRLNQRGPTRVSALFLPMMIANMAAGSIAIKYDAQGPCLPTVTACATSTHAAGVAYRAIAHGYADAIIAGGAEATINPLAVAGFTTCMALSLETDPLKASLPFDARRAGFVMGEGSGILVLEEYEHANARGAKIYAEVAGYGNTCDAHHVTAPRPDGTYETNHDSRVKANDYKLLPGHEYIKDPTVTVLEGSESSYVRMLVTISNANALKEVFGDDFLPEKYVKGWDSTAWIASGITENTTANTITYEFRYKETVAAPTADVVLDDLFESFTVPGSVNNDQLAKLKDMTITVVAHAIQADGFDNADAAWAAFPANP